MWEMLRDGMKRSAEKVLGWEECRQPEWFRDSFVDLEKLISNRNLLFSKWLSAHHITETVCQSEKGYGP